MILAQRFLFLIMFLVCPIVALAQTEVEVVFSSGAVEVDPSGHDGFQMAKEGMLLSTGAVIRTSAGSYAQLSFDEDDQNIVRVEENTTAVVIIKDNEKIELLKGEVFAIIHKLPSGTSFEIKTPTAVAGARGTEWVTRFNNDMTEVEAYDDNPFVKTIDEKGQVSQEETPVKTGYATSVKRFERPKEFKQIPVHRQQRWQALRQEVRHRTEAERKRRGHPERKQQNLPHRANASGLPNQNIEKARKQGDNTLNGAKRIQFLNKQNEQIKKEIKNNSPQSSMKQEYERKMKLMEERKKTVPSMTSSSNENLRKNNLKPRPIK